MLRVLVYSRGEWIGTADLHADDPPMGVVSGELRPAAGYAALRPEIDAVFNGRRTWRDLELEVRMENGEILRGVGGVMVEEWMDRPGGDTPTVTVCGVDAPFEQFKLWFGDDPNFKRYFG